MEPQPRRRQEKESHKVGRQMSHLLWYTKRTIMNEDEQQLNALLDAICEGVEAPTEDQELEALANQSS